MSDRHLTNAIQGFRHHTVPFELLPSHATLTQEKVGLPLRWSAPHSYTHRISAVPRSRSCHYYQHRCHPPKTMLAIERLASHPSTPLSPRYLALGQTATITAGTTQHANMLAIEKARIYSSTTISTIPGHRLSCYHQGCNDSAHHHMLAIEKACIPLLHTTVSAAPCSQPSSYQQHDSDSGNPMLSIEKACITSLHTTISAVPGPRPSCYYHCRNCPARKHMLAIKKACISSSTRLSVVHSSRHAATINSNPTQETPCLPQRRLAFPPSTWFSLAHTS